MRTPARRAAKPPSDARLTRERIVEVALELLATHGAERLSMRSLADALGTAPMSLYRHVRGKDDLLSAIVATRRPGTIVIGFKAETGDATAEAGRMLRDKKLDLVVANDVADPRSAFGSDDDEVAFVSADGIERLPLLKKTEVARRLVEKLAERLAR